MVKSDHWRQVASKDYEFCLAEARETVRKWLDGEELTSRDLFHYYMNRAEIYRNIFVRKGYNKSSENLQKSHYRRAGASDFVKDLIWSGQHKKAELENSIKTMNQHQGPLNIYDRINYYGAKIRINLMQVWSANSTATPLEVKRAYQKYHTARRELQELMEIAKEGTYGAGLERMLGFERKYVDPNSPDFVYR